MDENPPRLAIVLQDGSSRLFKPSLSGRSIITVFGSGLARGAITSAFFAFFLPNIAPFSSAIASSAA